MSEAEAEDQNCIENGEDDAMYCSFVSTNYIICECGETFASEEVLKTHLCNKFFQTEADQAECIQHHQKTHIVKIIKPPSPPPFKYIIKPIRKKRNTDEDRSGDWHKCEDCGAMFQSEEVLWRHRELNDCDINNRPCSQCGENFQTDVKLKEHTKTVHDGTMCEEVHTGEKPFSCPHCDKSFTQSNSMKLHVNTVHLKMPAPYRARKKKYALQ